MPQNVVNNKKVKVNTKSKAPLKSKGATFDEPKKSSHPLLIFLLFIVIVGVIAGALTSPVFNLSEVIIADGTNVSKEEVYNVIPVSYGKNIFAQDYKNMKKSVCSLPYIKDASIKLILPDQLEIKYEERVPYALIKYLESYVVIDKTGFLLEILKEKKEGLPIIYGIDLENVAVGETLDDVPKAKYHNIVVLLETASQRNFPYTIEEIDYATINQVKIWVTGIDIDIVYGEIEQNEVSDKLNYLSEILNKIKDKKGKLDLSSDNYTEKAIFSERIS